MKIAAKHKEEAGGGGRWHHNPCYSEIARTSTQSKLWLHKTTDREQAEVQNL